MVHGERRSVSYNKTWIPGDSIRDQTLSPIWRSLYNLTFEWRGHVNSPSQKGHPQNCQVIVENPEVVNESPIEKKRAF